MRKEARSHITGKPKKVVMLKELRGVVSLVQLQELRQRFPIDKTQAQLEGISRLSLGRLRTCKAVFQPRDTEQSAYLLKVHIRALTAAAVEGRTFDPIVVLPVKLTKDGEILGVICDGHCRALAALQAGLKAIPVKVHTGDIHDALRVVAEENLISRLPLTKEERTEAAWRRLVARVIEDEVVGQRSPVRKLEQELGIPKSTVQKMLMAFAYWTDPEVQRVGF